MSNQNSRKRSSRQSAALAAVSNTSTGMRTAAVVPQAGKDDEAIARNWEAFTHYSFSAPLVGSSISQSDIDDRFNRLAEDTSVSGDPVPPPEVVAEAKRIVSALRYQLPPDTDIYSPGDGKVEVEVSGATGYGLSLICEPGGSALCLIVARDSSRRSRYNNSSSELPDGFLGKGLADVCRSRGQDFFTGEPL